MISLPAQVLGLRDRGLVREGHRADIVVMDLDTIRDKATALEPHQYPEGVEYVLINGRFVVEEGKQTNALPGVVITPADRAKRQRQPRGVTFLPETKPLFATQAAEDYTSLTFA